MKCSSLLAATFIFVSVSFASSNPENKILLNASQVLIPVGSTGKTISLLDMSRISIKDVEAYTGEKMRFAERVAFKLAQVQLRKSIDPDGTINSDKIAKQFSGRVGVTRGFHLGGFALGFLLSIIGVGIAYLIKVGDHRGRVRWAWIGAAISLVIFGLVILI